MYNEYNRGSSGTQLAYTFTSSGTYRVVASVFTNSRNGDHTRLYCNGAISSSTTNMWDASSKDWGGSGWYGGNGENEPSTALIFSGLVYATSGKQVLVKCVDNSGYMQLFVEKLAY